MTPVPKGKVMEYATDYGRMQNCVLMVFGVGFGAKMVRGYSDDATHMLGTRILLLADVHRRFWRYIGAE